MTPPWILGLCLAIYIVSAKKSPSCYGCCMVYLEGNYKTNVNAAVKLVTMKTDNVFDSEDFSVGVNSIYAAFNEYDLNILPVNIGEKKWEVVRILAEYFGGNLEHPSEGKYIVWVDPKVIFVDMKFRIEQMANEYPKANILISTIGSELTDGFLILKVCDWSKQFIIDWWSNYNHSASSPVLALRHLATKSSNAQNVQLLPSQGLWLYNSLFKERNVKSPIVNMIEEDDMFRSLVFGDAWSTICSKDDMAECTTITSEGLCTLSSNLPPLLGLTSHRLEELEELVLPRKMKLLTNHLERAKSMGNGATLSFWAVDEIYREAKAIMKIGESIAIDETDSDNEAVATLTAMRQIETEMLVWVYVGLRDATLNELAIVEGRPLPTQDKEELVDMVLQTVQVGFEAMAACESDDSRVSMRSQLLFEIFSNILPTIRSILEVVGNVRQVTSEFRALTFKARLHIKRGEVELFEEAVQDATHVWNRIQEDHAGDALMPEALKLAGKFFAEAGQIWCDIGRRDEGLQSLSRGIGAVVNQLNAEYKVSVEGRAIALELELAHALTDSGICAYELFVGRAGRSVEVEQVKAAMGIHRISEEHLTKAIAMFSQWKQKMIGQARDMDRRSEARYNEAKQSLKLLQKAKRRAEGDNVDKNEDDLIEKEEQRQFKKTTKRLMRKKRHSAL